MPSYCVFCGVPFLSCPRRDDQGNESMSGQGHVDRGTPIQGHYVVEAIPKAGEFDDMEWLNSIRGILDLDEVNFPEEDENVPQQGSEGARARLSGTGHYEFDDSEDSADVPWTWGIPEHVTRFTMFVDGLPLHESCGKLFGRVLSREGMYIYGFDNQLRDSDEEVPEETVLIELESVKEYLMEFSESPGRRVSDSLCLDYGELVSRAQTPNAWQCEPGDEWIVADPWNISLLQAFPPMLPQEPELASARLEASHTDPLSVLPYDIAVTIFRLLSTRDLQSLRIASRWMNHLPTPAIIYKRIIREELLVHHDIPWEAPANSELDVGYWKALLLHLRRDKGIQNRMRISRIMRNMALDLLERETGFQFPEGGDGDKLEAMKTIAFSNVTQGYEGSLQCIAANKLSRPRLRRPGGPLYFSPEVVTEVRIYTKSHQHTSRKTISCLSFAGTAWTGSKSLGFVSNDDTTEEVWTLDNTLKEFAVSFDEECSLCGLRLITASGESPTFGSAEGAFLCLEPLPGHITVGLSAYYSPEVGITSLGIIERNPTADEPPELITRSFPRGATWTERPPPTDLKIYQWYTEPNDSYSSHPASWISWADKDIEYIECFSVRSGFHMVSGLYFKIRGTNDGLTVGTPRNMWIHNDPQRCKTEVFTIQPEEKIVGVVLHTGYWVDGIAFILNTNRISPHLGGYGGRTYVAIPDQSLILPGQIIGLHWVENQSSYIQSRHLIQIGVLLDPSRPSILLSGSSEADFRGNDYQQDSDDDESNNGGGNNDGSDNDE